MVFGAQEWQEFLFSVYVLLVPFYMAGVCSNARREYMAMSWKHRLDSTRVMKDEVPR